MRNFVSPKRLSNFSDFHFRTMQGMQLLCFSWCRKFCVLQGFSIVGKHSFILTLPDSLIVPPRKFPFCAPTSKNYTVPCQGHQNKFQHMEIFWPTWKLHQMLLLPSGTVLGRICRRMCTPQMGAFSLQL